MIRLYYSRMTFFYYATSLYAVFDNVPPSTIMCGFSVKESQTDAYSIVRQKLYFNVRLTKVKSSKFNLAYGRYFWAGVRIYQNSF